MPTWGQINSIALRDLMNATPDAVYNSDLRLRGTDHGQEIVDEIWYASDWEFKQAYTTLNLLSGGTSVNAPTDYDAIGENGGLYFNGKQTKLAYKDPNALYRIREELNQTAQPRYYTVSRNSGSSTYLPVLQFDTTADQNYTLDIYYDTKPPLLLDAPLKPTTAAGSATGLTGAYLWAVSFVDVDGNEGEVGFTSTSLTLSNQKGSLTAIPTGNASVAQRKVYRTTAGGSTLKLVTTLADNTTTTYTDNTADGSLGATAPTSSLFQKIPPQYHRSVVLKGLLARLAKDFGDMRADRFFAEYQEALGAMKARRKEGLDEITRIGDTGLPTWGMW